MVYDIKKRFILLPLKLELLYCIFCETGARAMANGHQSICSNYDHYPNMESDEIYRPWLISRRETREVDLLKVKKVFIKLYHDMQYMLQNIASLRGTPFSCLVLVDPMHLLCSLYMTAEI